MNIPFSQYKSRCWITQKPLEIGFFFFWSFGALASMLSLYLVRADTPKQPF
jgi:hypothetical protein